MASPSPVADNYEENKKIFGPLVLNKPEDKTQSAQIPRIIKHEAPWKIYALGYSWRPDLPFRFGLGSFLEGKENKVFLIRYIRLK